MENGRMKLLFLLSLLVLLLEQARITYGLYSWTIFSSFSVPLSGPKWAITEANEIL